MLNSELQLTFSKESSAGNLAVKQCLATTFPKLFSLASSEPAVT